jgi:ankyrin repeat protein
MGKNLKRICVVLIIIKIRMKKNVSIYGLILVFLFGTFYALTTKSLVFVFFHILLPIIGIIIIVGLVVTLIQSSKRGSKRKPEDNNRKYTSLNAALKDDANLETINGLINSGADVNEQSEGAPGWTPIWYAVLCDTNPNMIDIIASLSKAGADVNFKNKDGNTPLIYAAYFGHVRQISALIKAGADLNLKDRDGKTALEIAQESNKFDAVALLKEAEMNIAPKFEDTGRIQSLTSNTTNNRQEVASLSPSDHETDIKNQLGIIRSKFSILENAYVASNINTGPKEMTEIEKVLSEILSYGDIGLQFLLERIKFGVTFSGTNISLYNWGEDTSNELIKKQIIIKAIGAAKTKGAIPELERLLNANCNNGQWREFLQGPLSRAISSIKTQ